MLAPINLNSLFKAIPLGKLPDVFVLAAQWGLGKGTDRGVGKGKPGFDLGTVLGSQAHVQGKAPLPME